MEVSNELYKMLDLLIRPGFCAEDHKIVYCNTAAQALLLLPGTDVRDLLLTGQEEYDALADGCLYLQLNLLPGGCGASVMVFGSQKIFLLDQTTDDDALQALALAARELRQPLAGIQALASQLSVQTETDREHLARLNRSIHQMLRLIGNMTDAGRSSTQSNLILRDIPKVISEIFLRAQTLTEQAGTALHYQCTAESVLGLADEDQLERAILNILSNAIKFSPKGSPIHATLSRRGRTLMLRITDSGSGIAENLRENLFRRYLRQPGIEDSRYGLGLGMVIVRNAAALHGGTVLLDQPEGSGTRVTMTLAIRQDTSSLRSPVLQVDYTGELDHGLVELADCLPLDVYFPN